MVCTAKYGITDDSFLAKMIEQCDNDRDRGLVYILYFTGMHGSCLSTLTLDSLKHEGDKVYIRWRRTKTKKQMEAPLPKDKLPIIETFLTARKRSIQWTNIALKDIGQRAGFDDVTTMTFRHTRCIQLIKKGIPLSVIAEVMGCTVGVIIRNYGKLTETQKRELIE